jgi:hypothetical protein
MKALSAISDRLKQGASVSEVNDAFRAHEFPALESVQAQIALLKAVEQAGQSAVVHQVRMLSVVVFLVAVSVTAAAAVVVAIAAYTNSSLVQGPVLGFALMMFRPPTTMHGL